MSSSRTPGPRQAAPLIPANSIFEIPILKALLAPGWSGHILALLSGALITLSLAPFDIWPLGIVSLLLLHLLLERLEPRQAAARGWWFGAGLFVSGGSWLYVSIHDFGGAPVPLATLLAGGFCLLLALMQAMLGYGYVRWLRDRPVGRWLGFAAWWVLWEWVRYWLLTGFPWLYVGYAHLGTPLGGWAPAGGIHAIGFGVALSAAALALVLQRRPARIPLAAAAALWIGGALLQQIAWTKPKGEPLKVALVQANIPQSVKWDPASFRSTLEIYRDISAPLWRDNDIVFWPEAAIPAFYDHVRDYFDSQAALAASHGHALISGIPSRDATAPQPQALFNSAIALGNGSGIYHKQHLVPFGEYVPLEAQLRGLIQFFDLPMSDFQGGDLGQPPLRAGDTTFAPYICYEVVYGDLVRHARGDVLLTLSNDAWFGHSIGPLQHLQMAQMRALELGRYMVRATGNGVTALINERGRITDRIPQFERTVLRGSIQPFDGLTPYAQTGSWPILGFSGLVVIGCAIAGRRSRDN